MSGRHGDLRQPDLQRVGRYLLTGVGTEQNGLDAQCALHAPASTRIVDQGSDPKLRLHLTPTLKRQEFAPHTEIVRETGQ